MINVMYEDYKCSVVDGVKMRCNISEFLFLIIIDRIMKQTTSENNTGIRWKMATKLDYLDFADDIALNSRTKDKMQKKMDNMNKHATSIGLKINAAKTKAIRLNVRSKQPLVIQERR